MGNAPQFSLNSEARELEDRIVENVGKLLEDS
jgi:hypothetical protein